MSVPATLNPQQQTRAQLLRSMSPVLQEKAKVLEELHREQCTGVVTVYFLMGQEILDIRRAEITEADGQENPYGKGAIAKIANFLNMSTQNVRNLARVAETFTKETIETWTSKPFPNGGHLQMSHFVELVVLDDDEERNKIMTRAVKAGLSVRQLHDLIVESKTGTGRAARRTAARPVSPAAGLQRILAGTTGLVEFLPTAETQVFDAIDVMSPDDVDETLLRRLQETEAKLGETVVRAKEAQTHVQNNIKRVERVLAAHKDDAEVFAEQDADAPVAAPAKKRHKKLKAKAAAEARLKGKQKKNKKRVATA